MLPVVILVNVALVMTSPQRALIGETRRRTAALISRVVLKDKVLKFMAGNQAAVQSPRNGLVIGREEKVTNGVGGGMGKGADLNPSVPPGGQISRGKGG